ENYFSVYIDFNGNGTLDDEGEVFDIPDPLENTDGDDPDAAVTFDITIPEDAVSGDIRMRVIKKFGSNPDNPCDNFSWGQIEDYSLSVSDDGSGSIPETDCSHGLSSSNVD